MTESPSLPPTEPTADRRLWAVVPAGGSGTRLWPLSREARPKFLLPLLSARSLLQQTVDRVAPISDAGSTLVVCGPAHAAAVARQLPEVPAANIVVEPGPRGTGPAIGLAAAIIHRQDPAAVMGSFAADHAVRDLPAMQRALDLAVAAAQDGWLVTIGLTPSRPETGYGYVERTDHVIHSNEHGTVYRASRFVEKPDLSTATAYVRSGRFLWNASMFVWRVDALLAEMANLQPELHAGLLRIAGSWGTPNQDRVLDEVWRTLPESTIDRGIMERAERVAVVPADFGWSDIGDWHGLGELLQEGNLATSVCGDLIEVETSRSTVWSETERTIALVGVDNLVVVDTADALLVADRSRAQDVRRLVEKLKQGHRQELI